MKIREFTIIDEKFSILDEATVLYTANTKFLEHFKDSHAVFNDPTVIFCVFKKIDNRWRTIYAVVSYIERSIDEGN